MDGTVGVRFHEAAPLIWCSPGDLDLGLGDYVVVRTDRGDQLGWVVLAPDQLLAAEPEGPRRVIERLATEDDVTAWREARERARRTSPARRSSRPVRIRECGSRTSSTTSREPERT